MLPTFPFPEEASILFNLRAVLHSSNWDLITISFSNSF